MQARNLMTGNPVCCTPDTSLADAARRLADVDCGALPVVEATAAGTPARPLGVITDRDIVCRSLALGKDPMKLSVRDCMSVPCVTVLAGSSVNDCCDTMEANQIRRLVVVDDDGRCCGIIAQADLARGLSERLTAEVVREISLPTAAVRATF